MRILVLDGDQNQAVACVRSLARQGPAVLAGESRPGSKAGWSRFCSGTFQYPSPQSDPERFLDYLLAASQEKTGTLILPMTEATTLVLSAHRDRFAATGTRLVLPLHGDLLRAVDKSQTTL